MNKINSTKNSQISEKQQLYILRDYPWIQQERPTFMSN